MNNLQAVPIDGGYVVKRTPGRVHGTFDKAAAEAVRLTAANDGPAFIVLKIVGVVIGGETVDMGIPITGKRAARPAGKLRPRPGSNRPSPTSRPRSPDGGSASANARCPATLRSEEHTSELQSLM